MSSARITIGGLDVSPYPGAQGGGMLPEAESRSPASANQTHDGQHAPMILVMEHAPRPRCPLPHGLWRVLCALVMLGLTLTLVMLLGERQRHAVQDA